jgi:nucleoside-diphosphate-sugar epimerase
MKKRVLVTGATGFVGRHVLKHLAEQDVEITIIVRDVKDASSFHNELVEHIVLSEDIFKETVEWWASVLCDIDTLIHLAWYVEPGLYLQSSKNLDCLHGTFNIAKGAVQAGVRKFVGIGTCFEYDLTHGMLSIQTPLRPLTPYAGAKAAVYNGLSQILPVLGVEFLWCRLFYLFGEGEHAHRLVPYIRNKLKAGEIAELTSGNQIRDYIDVFEAGRLIVKAALGDVQGPVNICSGMPITIRQLAENIADECGRRDLLNFGVRPANFIDPSFVVGVRGDI